MIEMFSWVICVAGTVLTLPFILEVAMGLLPAHPSPRRSEAVRLSGVVVIPAHDEAQCIGDTLRALRSELPSSFDILVVADNCSDQTAAIARRLGAEAIERRDPERRGKGYALAFAREFLRDRRPECVIVLDADCWINSGGIEELAHQAMMKGTAVQAKYLLRPAATGSPLARISTLAFMIKNSIRQRGLTRLGAPAVLTGSGMAFPWKLFDRKSLGGGSLAEDLELSVTLVADGYPPAYCDAVIVWSDAPPERALRDQRARWEGGFLITAATRAAPLLANGLRRASWPMLWMGLHLLVPPLTLLILLDLSFLGGLILLSGWSPPTAAFAAHACLVTMLAFVLTIAWVLHGRTYLPAVMLTRIPLYILWKIPIYVRLLARRNVRWIRTERP